MATPLATATLDALLEASIAGGLAIAIAWLICRGGRLHPRWQVLIWWAASLKLLTALAGVPAIPLPVLPAIQAPTGEPAAHSTPVPMAGPAATSPAAATHARVPPTPASSVAAATTEPLGAGSIATLILATLWLLGVAVAGARLLFSCLHLRRLLRRATPADEEVAAVARHAASRAGVRGVPPTWMSEDIQTPQTIGALHPAILLPAAARGGWTGDELRMALSHEMAHVRRRDLLWGWIPLVADSLFFFHPLARIAAREYLVAREAACDAEALETAQASPDDYGRLLARLGIDKSGCALAAGGASGSRSVLARRLEMLVRSPRRLSRPGQLALAGFAVLALLPLELTARQTEAPRAVTAAPAAPLQAPRPVAPAPPSETARPASAAPAAPTRPARPVARAVRQARPSSPLPVQAPRPVEPAQPGESRLQRELEAARRQAAEREREADDAAREMRALESLLREERARATRTADEAREQMRRLRLEQQAKMKADLDLAARDLEEARNALRAQDAPDARSEQERVRGLEEMARSDDRMRLLRERLQLLGAQQQSLLNEQQALAQQQQALADAQRRLAEELARVREALDAAQ
jgi:beta-lactamase regulating signal transducer with metallopeptidase domain